MSSYAAPRRRGHVAGRVTNDTVCDLTNEFHDGLDAAFRAIQRLAVLAERGAIDSAGIDEAMDRLEVTRRKFGFIEDGAKFRLHGVARSLLERAQP